MKFPLFLLIFLFVISGCQKTYDSPNERWYSASYTFSASNCDVDYGFRVLGSEEGLKSSLGTRNLVDGEWIEFRVELCSNFPFNSLPETIPAVVYKNGEVFLSIELVPDDQLSRNYIYHFRHYH